MQTRPSHPSAQFTFSPTPCTHTIKQRSLIRLRMASSVASDAAGQGSAEVQSSTGPEQLASGQWSDYHQKWFDIWQSAQTGQVPKFDKGSCSPQLLQLLQDDTLKVRGKRVLIPGCGRGYDVFAFAAAGASLSVGLDICPTAVAAAAAERDKVLASSDAGAAAAATAELIVGDFFSYEHGDGQKFDIGYDYTFLCALHPDMREAWAHGWARLLNQGGELVTMIYPVDATMANAGPPWPVTPELYKQLLSTAGFDTISLSQIPQNLSHPSRAGKEWLGRWKLTKSIA